MNNRRVTEVKRHLDGRVERFDCELLARRPHLAILRFDFERAMRAGEVLIPKGSRSYGFFWRRRPYQLYRVVGPEGGVIGHRFDAVEDTRLGVDEVSYTDLLLDLWVDPQGAVRVEDEGEVADFARRGLLSKEQRERIDRAKTLLLRRHGVITREAARLLQSLGIA